MGRQRQQQQRRQQQFIFAGATAVLLYVILFGFGTSSTHNSSSLSISREAQEHLNAQQRLLLTTVQWPDGTLPPSASGARPKRKPASKQEAQTALQEHFVVLNRCVMLLKKKHRSAVEALQGGDSAAKIRKSAGAQEMWAELAREEDENYHALKHRLKQHVQDTKTVGEALGVGLDEVLMGQYVERTEALFIEPETVSVEAGATTDTSQHILTENAESLLTQMIFEWPLGQNHRHPGWSMVLGERTNRVESGSPASMLSRGSAGIGGSVQYAPGKIESAEDCGPHGLLTKGKGGMLACECTLLWQGHQCDQRRPEAADKLKYPLRTFGGDFTISQQGHEINEELTVFLPDKKTDSDSGVRTLGTLTTEVLAMLPAEQVLRDSYRTCAIVGSSGILLHHEHGEDIDGHDLVMRFNSAKTIGFEKYVGSKTTHRITNTQNFGFRESDKEQALVHMRAKGSFDNLVKTLTNDPTVHIAAFSPSYVSYMATTFPKFLVTSGMYGIILALQKCAKIDVYGFQVSTQHGTLYHYYGPCDQPANIERDGLEFEVFKDLVDNGFITLNDECVIECHDSEVVCEECKQRLNFKPIVIDREKECVPCDGGLIVNGKCRMSAAQRLEAQEQKDKAKIQENEERAARIQARKEREERRIARAANSESRVTSEPRVSADGVDTTSSSSTSTSGRSSTSSSATRPSRSRGPAGDSRSSTTGSSASRSNIRSRQDSRT